MSISSASAAAGGSRVASTCSYGGAFDVAPGVVVDQVELAPVVRTEGWVATTGSPDNQDLRLTRSLVAPTSALDEAASAANGVRLNAQLAGQEIAGGHAYLKHVVERGEFPGTRTRAQFAEMVESVITDYSDIRQLSGGRTAFWRDGVVVIRNPSAIDGASAFVPRDGYDYFLNDLN